MNHCLDEGSCVSRRGMLAITGRVAALAVVGAAAPRLFAAEASAESNSTPTDQVRYVVTDRRYPQSLAFARTVKAPAASQLEVTEGLTRMWQDSLEPLWERDGGAVVGLTTIAVWHCLAEQGRSQGRSSRLLQQYTGPTEPLVAWIIT